MHKFTDTKGEEWHVECDIAALKRLKKNDISLNALGSGDPDKFWEAIGDQVFIATLLFALIEPQRIERKLEQEEFFKRMSDGDVIEAATDAFLQAYMDSLPKKRRKVMQEALEKKNLIEDKIITKMGQKINEVNVTDKDIEAMLKSL